MALDFPRNPTAGQTYAYGGKTWSWNGTIWAPVTNPSLGLPAKTVLMRLTSALRTPSGVSAAVPWSDSVNAEAAGVWSSATPTRIMLPNGFSKIRLTYQIGFAPNGNGERYVALGQNGSGLSLYGGAQARFNANTTGNRTDVNAITGILTPGAGTYYEVFTYQNSGADVDLAAPNLCWTQVELW